MNQYKDDILASVTHDLKTPLNAIDCYVQVTQMELQASPEVNQNEAVLENMKIIQKSSQLLQNLIMDILDFS